MRHGIMAVLTALVTLAAPTIAQDSSGSTNSNRPAVWTQNARSRHQEIQQARLYGGGYIPEGSTLGAESSGSSSSGGLSDLLGSLGGSTGLSGLLSSVVNSGLLGSLGSSLGSTSAGSTGSSSGSTETGNGTTSTGGSTSSNPNIPPNVTPEVIAMLEGAGIDINEVFPPDDTGSSSSTGSRSKSVFGSAAQSTNPPTVVEEEDSFRTRLINALLETTFAALILAFQNQAFIERIADAIRPTFGPILNPDAYNTEEDDATEETGEESEETPETPTTGESPTTGEGSIVMRLASLPVC